MPVSDDAFRQALSRFASGVTVVTTRQEAVQTGLTVTAFCSVSLHPPSVLVCIDKRSSSLDLVRGAGAFAVNLLSDQQAHLSIHFAGTAEDKLASVPHRHGALGQPLLDGTLATLECSLQHEYDGGDHTILVGLVETAHVQPDLAPLTYYTGGYHHLRATQD